MQESTVSTNVVSIGSKDILTDILRQGAQKMLATAIDCEVNEYLAEHAHQLDTDGKRLVVRNGYLPRPSCRNFYLHGGQRLVTLHISGLKTACRFRYSAWLRERKFGYGEF
jgi:hypothetical protein